MTRRWRPLERTGGVAFVVLVATLTLEWISLGGFMRTLDVKPFHFAALLLIAVCLLRFLPRHRVVPILRRYRVFYGSWALYVAFRAVMTVAHRDPYTSREAIVREVLYGTVSVFVAAFFLDVDRRRVRRILQWTAVITVAVLVTSMTVTLLAQGSDPVKLLRTAIARGDPDIVSYQLLRASFRSQDLADVGANLRHKVFAPLLIAVAVALLCRTRPRGVVGGVKNALLAAAALAGTLLVVVSLSRSLILCVALTLGLIALRLVVRARAHPRQLLAVTVAVVVIAGLAVSPLGALVWTRWQNTGTYEARVAALSSSVVPVSAEAAVLGVERGDVGTSPHNIVIDGWLSAGVFGAVTSAVFLLSFVAVWLREVRRHLTGAASWTLQLGHVWVVAAGTMPLVRSVTGGQGFHLNDWVCIGVVFGLVEANRLRSAARPLRRSLSRRPAARPAALAGQGR